MMNNDGIITKMKRKAKRRIQKQQRRALFPLLLAAICSESDDSKLIKKCLNKVFRSLPDIQLSPFLSLLPALLKFNRVEIVVKSLEIIGAASLASFAMNEEIAMEDEIVKGIISLVGAFKREIATAACNTVLDLSTTSVGRRRILEFNAITNLLYSFIQESEIQCLTEPHGTDVILLEEEYTKLILKGAIALINSCTIEQLQHIPIGLSEKSTVLLKLMWGEVYRHRCDEVNKLWITNISMNTMAESIFRLCIDCSCDPGTSVFENVKKSIFGSGEVGIERFLSENWEISPVLLQNASEASIRQDTIFSSFSQYLGLKENIPSFLPSMLKSTISCPPITSDELDILNVINEIKDHLGCPIVYNQDIRVVKTQLEGGESHYFQDQSIFSCTLIPHVLSMEDIMRCEEAFKQGYSIALRGMEFRFQTIAAVAGILASLFGQPSAGVNMYLTPSNSQGLARHSDDHCVFVCQLIGMKRWTIFPRPNSWLPRLYEQSDTINDLEGDRHEIGGCQHFLLKEGDILYIPRGFPHEARTDAVDNENVNDTTGFSLHLTLAIEIEPPFEWEGFMHIALHSWYKKEKALQHIPVDSMLWNLHLVSVKLLHITIKLIGNLDPRFRKACLVGATPLTSYTTEFHFNNQREMFRNLISQIASKSKFSDALEHLEATMQKNDDPLEHVRWMEHLATEGEVIKRSPSLDISSSDSCYLFNLVTEHLDIAEASFLKVKSKFCGMNFQDALQHYKMLLEKYRKVRKEYTNGMLSLHSALT